MALPYITAAAVEQELTKVKTELEKEIEASELKIGELYFTNEEWEALENEHQIQLPLDDERVKILQESIIIDINGVLAFNWYGDSLQWMDLNNGIANLLSWGIWEDHFDIEFWQSYYPASDVSWNEFISAPHIYIDFYEWEDLKDNQTITIDKNDERYEILSSIDRVSLILIDKYLYKLNYNNEGELFSLIATSISDDGTPNILTFEIDEQNEEIAVTMSPSYVPVQLYEHNITTAWNVEGPGVGRLTFKYIDSSSEPAIITTNNDFSDWCAHLYELGYTNNTTLLSVSGAGKTGYYYTIIGLYAFYDEQHEFGDYNVKVIMISDNGVEEGYLSAFVGDSFIDMVRQLPYGPHNIEPEEPIEG